MLWDVRGTVLLGRLCWGASLPVPVLWVQLFVFCLYCSSRSEGSRCHVGTGSWCMWDLRVFLQCMMEIVGRLACFGAAADVFCCHISVTSKELQCRRGTLSCLIWPPAPRLGHIYLNFPSRCLSRAVVESLQWSTFLILPGWSLKVGHCSCHYWDFPSLWLWFLCSSWELLPSCPFVTVQRVLFSPLELPLGISGPCLPWAAGSKTCLECCVRYLRALSQQTPLCDSQVDFWGAMNAF